jgi:dTDP-4-amino-4,6-dideoxygalactose transaminase
MFVTDDPDLFAKAKQLWSFGETRTPMESRDYHAYALGWMYRNNDLTAAFGRAQLKKIDRHLAIARANAEVLAGQLQGTPHLILPVEPAGYSHNWYNYTLRFDLKALGHQADAGSFRDKIVKALQAEGVQTGIWQKYILPAMTVFQAKNSYGKGCPWSCPHSRPVDYSLSQYPQAVLHSDTHTGMTVPMRAPNGPQAAQATAAGIRKVMANVKELEKLTLK